MCAQCMAGAAAAVGSAAGMRAWLFARFGYRVPAIVFCLAALLAAGLLA